MEEEKKTLTRPYKKGRLSADSWRLIDIIAMTTCGALSIILVFMVSLGYPEIHAYMSEIERFPYFIAFLPAFLSSLIHAIINYFCGRGTDQSLMDFNGVPSGKRGVVGLFTALMGTIITLLFVILLLTDVIPGADYRFVLAALPMGLFSYAFFLFDQIAFYIKEDNPKGIVIPGLLVLGFGLPVGVGLGTYLPGVTTWGFVAISFIPFVYVITSSLSMTKKGTDIEGKDDI